MHADLACLGLFIQIWSTWVQYSTGRILVYMDRFGIANDFTGNLLLKTRLLLADWIYNDFKRRPRDSAVILHERDLCDYPILEDPHALTALRRMVTDLEPDFSYRHFVIDGEWHGFSVSIEDRDKLGTYVKTLEAEWLKTRKRKKDNPYSFIMNDDAELLLVDSVAPAYQMKRGSDRHRIVFFLAKKKKPASSIVIARELKLETMQIRKTVEALRALIQKKFNVPRNALVESEDAGYTITNLTLHVPKGYTP